MEDHEIVSLYWQRSENAIPETARKYGRYCAAVARNILTDPQDAEECVNDTWLGAWNSMPDNRPAKLAPYLGKLTRWLALTRLKNKNRLKRGGGEVSVALEELEDCIPADADVEAELECRELSVYVRAFLGRLGREERLVFLSRYWMMDSIGRIAELTGFSESKVKSMLLRTRGKLRAYLEEEGLC